MDVRPKLASGFRKGRRLIRKEMYVALTRSIRKGITTTCISSYISSLWRKNVFIWRKY
jgi:hypothetical protein